jgi:hypothetical protein
MSLAPDNASFALLRTARQGELLDLTPPQAG